MLAFENIIKYALIILIISSSFILVSFYNIRQGYWWDEAVYLGLAKNIYDGKGYWVNMPYQESFRPPLFPYIIAGIWYFTGISEAAVNFLPIIFGILSVVMLYFLANKLYGGNVALWSAAVLATSELFLFFSSRLLTESLFVFLGTSGIYLYYSGIENKRMLFVSFSGIVFALAFLTRYAGIMFVIIYFLYPFLIKEKKIFLNIYYIIGVILFFAAISPWLAFNYLKFGSPLTFLIRGIGDVATKYYTGPWYFYLANWTGIFGLIGIFALPGIILFLKKKRDSDIIVLFIAITSLLFFFALARKEPRYMLHFIQFYSIIMAAGLVWISEGKNKLKFLVPVVGLIFISIGLFSGIQMVNSNINGGIALKEAALYLKDKNITSIISNDYPVLYYITQKPIINFPEKESDFILLSSNASYIVINSMEPTYPDYVWNSNTDKSPSAVLENNFVFENSFEENDKKVVWVYKT